MLLRTRSRDPRPHPGHSGCALLSAVPFGLESRQLVLSVLGIR